MRRGERRIERANEAQSSHLQSFRVTRRPGQHDVCTISAMEAQDSAQTDRHLSLLLPLHLQQGFRAYRLVCGAEARHSDLLSCAVRSGCTVIPPSSASPRLIST